MEVFSIGFLLLFPKDYVEWGKECGERGMKFNGSWLMLVHGSWDCFARN